MNVAPDWTILFLHFLKEGPFIEQVHSISSLYFMEWNIKHLEWPKLLKEKNPRWLTDPPTWANLRCCVSENPTNKKSKNCSLTQLITKHGVIIECHRTWQTKYVLNKSALIFWKRELWGQRHTYASFEGKIKNFSRN